MNYFLKCSVLHCPLSMMFYSLVKGSETPYISLETSLYSSLLADQEWCLKTHCEFPVKFKKLFPPLHFDYRHIKSCLEKLAVFQRSSLSVMYSGLETRFLKSSN